VYPYEAQLDSVSTSTFVRIQKHPSIIEVGWQTDIRPYLPISDCFILPSYREGFPNIIMLAGAMELPCIVSDINGSNEIIKDRENGLIVPPKEKDSLFMAMHVLIKDKELRQNLASNAAPIIAERYVQKYVLGELL